MKIENLFSKQDISQVSQLGNSIQCFPSNVQTLGRICEKDSEFYAAKMYFNLALEIIQRNDACDVIDVADAYVNLGNVQTHLSDFHQAKEHYEYALAILLKELGPEHAYVTTAYNNLGNVHNKLGDLGRAKEYYDRALAPFV
ncbi:hypothetical protein OS493_036361 [Desmophyllum pertusum]|uniref:Tetratricopeptide repeat protein n=1 Tax=Desmophyllum pertusum TaxID=174260 RepID=A0A9W9Y7K6_9CNID|nr:hypothetical protein OS493_036361 [Desmophyllum pertusum]